MTYQNEPLKGNGSFYTETGGRVRYTGASSEDKNQVVAFSDGQYMAVDLSEMLAQQRYEFAESIVQGNEPDRRKSRESLESGDLWWDIDEDYTGYVYNGADWKPMPTVPFATIITTADPREPGGFLRCDGNEPPSDSKYDRIRELMEDENDGDLPSLSQSFPNYNYIKY